jgi:hypothetical protein
MAVRDSKTNKPKEQGGKTGQQMAGGYTMYATSPYPTKVKKELDPKTYMPDPSKLKTKKVKIK